MTAVNCECSCHGTRKRSACANCGCPATPLPDGWRFLGYNLQHYSLALWGLRLRLDPPYPHLTRFFPGLIGEPVFEYRTYGLHALWAILLASWLPLPLLTAFVLFWAGQTFDRSKFLKSNLVFWRQALKENGIMHRAAGRYMIYLLREIERRDKAGLEWQGLASEALELQDKVVAAAGDQRAARGILAGV